MHDADVKCYHLSDPWPAGTNTIMDNLRLERFRHLVRRFLHMIIYVVHTQCRVPVYIRDCHTEVANVTILQIGL